MSFGLNSTQFYPGTGDISRSLSTLPVTVFEGVHDSCEGDRLRESKGWMWRTEGKDNEVVSGTVGRVSMYEKRDLNVQGQ